MSALQLGNGVVPLRKVLTGYQPPDWIIDDLLPIGLGMLLGSSGAGKSAFAMDLCMHVATGKPWRGRAVKQSKVVWVAAESPESVPLRTLGAIGKFDKNTVLDDFHRIKTPLDITIPADLELLCSVLVEGVNLTVIDTLSAATASIQDENSKHMQLAINAAQRVQQKTKGCVLLVHHLGKDSSRGARGWSGLHAAMDTVLNLEKILEDDPFDAPRLCTVKKQRDGIDGEQFGYRLRSVVLGKKKSGRDLTSLQIEECPAPHKATPASHTTGKNRLKVLLALQTVPEPWTQAQVDAALSTVVLRSSRAVVRKWLLEQQLRLRPDGSYEFRDMGVP